MSQFSSAFILVSGLVCLLIGADRLVRGASRLAQLLGVSPLIIGLTVVAFGTSAPELGVSLQAVSSGKGEMALGNAVGSNIINVLLVIGVSAAITPLMVSQQLIRLDVPILIGLSIFAWALSIDGRLGRGDGILLILIGTVYTGFLIFQSRKESEAVQEMYRKKFGPVLEKKWKDWLFHLGIVVVGGILLVWGSRWFVSGAAIMARSLGMSELVIGLTILAVGTSLPEIATSVVASIRGERDIAVGTVVGSNLMNLVFVLGFSSIMALAGIPVPSAAIRFDMVVMIAVAIACLPIFFTGYTISRWEGLLFLGYYMAYILYLFLNSTQHQGLPTFSWVMMAFVIPLTVVTLLVLTYQAFRDRPGETQY
ncbi:MAG: calcium/sodium antiporter [Nitrospirales bacterium]|nr:calcium/sodium antiporter [Nitrospirales bacterium]